MNKKPTNSPVVASLSPLGLAASSPVTGAGATMPCRECDGKGEAEYMGLCDRYYRWADCHSCNGTGLEAAYCETCEGPLTDGLCRDCDFPSGWFLAERMALGMVKP